MKLLEKCRNFTEAAAIRERGWYPYFKVVESEQGAEAIVDGRRMIMIGSNNYLGLTNHLKVKEAVIKAVKQYGTGCTGSRYLNGTLSLHVEAEERLAEVFGGATGVHFRTRFSTHLGSLLAPAGQGGFFLSDPAGTVLHLPGCGVSVSRKLNIMSH